MSTHLFLGRVKWLGQRPCYLIKCLARSPKQRDYYYYCLCGVSLAGMWGACPLHVSCGRLHNMHTLQYGPALTLNTLQTMSPPAGSRVVLPPDISVLSLAFVPPFDDKIIIKYYYLENWTLGRLELQSSCSGPVTSYISLRHVTYSTRQSSRVILFVVWNNRRQSLPLTISQTMAANEKMKDLSLCLRRATSHLYGITLSHGPLARLRRRSRNVFPAAFNLSDDSCGEGVSARPNERLKKWATRGVCTVCNRHPHNSMNTNRPKGRGIENRSRAGGGALFTCRDPLQAYRSKAPETL